jgi:hypothetical protein
VEVEGWSGGRGNPAPLAGEAGEAPVVVVVGGFLTSPSFYAGLRRRLLVRGARAVVIAPIWTTHWLLAGLDGPENLLVRAARAVQRAAEVAGWGGPSGPGGRPLLLVGHSAGGLIGRRLLSPGAVAGRRLRAARAVGALVTLGTPHQMAPSRLADRWLGLSRGLPPGAPDGVPTLAVAANGVTVGRRDGGRRALVYRAYRAILGGDPGEPDGEIPGDGIVPVAAALLEGADHLVLDRCSHGVGPLLGLALGVGPIPWYGSDAAVDRWWPEAVGRWQRGQGATGKARGGRRRRPVPAEGQDRPRGDGRGPGR